MAKRGLPAQLLPTLAALSRPRMLAPGTLRGSDANVDLPPAAGGASSPIAGDSPHVSINGSLSGQPQAFALIAGEAALILPTNLRRNLLIIANMGTALAYVHFDNPVASVLGIPLAGGASIGLDVQVPTNPVSGYSPLGTSLYVYEG